MEYDVLVSRIRYAYPELCCDDEIELLIAAEDRIARLSKCDEHTSREIGLLALLTHIAENLG